MRKKERICSGDTEHIAAKLAVLLVIAVAVMFLSFMMGRYPIAPGEAVRLFLARCGVRGISVDTNSQMVFWNVRLPRVACAFLVGAGLSAAGCAYQGVFRNPMVSPDILGATQGAGFGAAIAMLIGFGVVGIQTISFLVGLLAVGITYTICLVVGRRGNVITTLILGGMVVGALFQAGISLIKYVADPYTKLPEITFWLMGSMSAVNWSDVLHLLIPVVLSCVPLFLYRWELNLLTFSDEEARTMGVNIPRLRITVILCATLISSAVVSVCGIVGWVGLIIPHLARMLVGANYKNLIPTSVILGGSYLLLVDDFARSWIAMEIPLGILTAIIGAPFFIYLLCKGRGGAL